MTFEISHADWVKAAGERYGSSSMQWRFRCPVCKIEISVGEWRAEDAPEGAVAFSCIGRYRDGDKANHAFAKDQKQPCNYAGGGLFRVNPIAVTDDQGVQHFFFDFADSPLSPGPHALERSAS